MYDHNVFAVLTSIDKRNNARSVFFLLQNAKWLRRANEDVVEVFTIDSRQSTSVTSSFMNEISDVTDCLILIFDELSRNFSNEVQFDTNSRSSHVLLKHRETQKISAKQYNIIVNDKLRIWLRDYSTHETAVDYNDQNETKFRKRQIWILCFQFDIFHIFEKITIHSKRLVIQIMFFNHETANLRYLQNLRETLKKNNEIVSSFDELDLNNNLDIATSSQVQTFIESNIYFE